MTAEAEHALAALVHDGIGGPANRLERPIDSRQVVATSLGQRETLAASDAVEQPRPGPDYDEVSALLVEGAALHLEADLKWLDLCEQRLGS